MTREALQKFLDEEKWKDSVARSCDMCGRYARCRYCVRTQEFPCAAAHNRLIEATSAPVPDHVPEWLLPEPDVLAKFGALVAEDGCADATAQEQSAQKDALPEAEDGAAAGERQTVPEETESGMSREDARSRVVTRGKKGDVRLCVLQRRLPTVSSELGSDL